MLDRTVRVFISSTFRDFGEERDLLMKRVFPELRRRARDRFVQVIGVDLRWGVTEEDSQQGETLPICLREIERSRPYFIGLLGERYGWTPNAGQYPELLLAQQPWLAAHAGGTSVTELEVLHGVLNNPEMAGRAFFYFRDAAWSDAKGPEFRTEGAEDQAKLARLKDGIRASVFPVVEYATPEAVADRITDDLWTLIDQQYPEDAVPNELERERRSHEAYAAERRRLYVGQDETVARLLARLEDASDEPGEDGSRTRITLVTGESGTGKSALLANTLTAYRAAHPNDVVIEHYIGSTSDASDPVKLMRRVAEEIKRLTGSTTDIDTDEDKLVEQFATWIADASYWAKRQGVRFVLVLDALDKLESRTNMRWLQRNILPNVRIVVSSLEGEARDALANRGIVELEAARFSADIARRYVTETLAHRGRKLPAHELDRIIAHPKSTLPLFLKTLVEELSVFGSYEGLPARISECLRAQEPDDLFEIIFARLEDDFGRDVVQKLLEAIAASSDGMSDDELLRFTGLAPLALARLKLALDDTLYEANGLIRMSHAYAQKGVQDRYMPTEEARRSIHRELGLWWEVQEPGVRMAREMNFQLYVAQVWNDLLRCLTTASTGLTATRYIEKNTLFASWRSLAAHNNSPSIVSFVTEQIGPTFDKWLPTRTVSNESLKSISCFTDFLTFVAPNHSLSQRVEVALTNLARDLLDAQPTIKNQRNLCNAINRQGLSELAAGRSAVTTALAAEALGIARQSYSDSGASPDLNMLILCLSFSADVNQELHGDLTTADGLYQESLGLCRHFVRDHRSLVSITNLTVCLARLAQNQKLMGNSRQALDLQHEALELSRKIVEMSGETWHLRGLAVTIDDVGWIEEELGSKAKALNLYLESLSIRRQLAHYVGNPESLRDLAISLRNIAGVEESDGNFDAALERCQESLGICRQLAEELTTPMHLRELSICLEKFGGIHRKRGDVEASIRCHAESLAIRRKLAQELATPLSLRDLGCAMHWLAVAKHMHGDLTSARSLCEEALNIRRQLTKSSATNTHLLDNCSSLSCLARIELKLNRPDGALVLAEEALAIHRRLWESEHSLKSCNEVVWSTQICVQILCALANETTALGRLGSSFDQACQLEASLDRNHLDTAAAYFECRAAVLSALGQKIEADESLVRSRALRARIVESGGSLR